MKPLSHVITLLLAFANAGRAEVASAERSLVPEKPGATPDYFCTWNVQGFACSYSGPSPQADAMVEANLFGKSANQGWLDFYPEVRGDLIFLLDDACDFPIGGGRDAPQRGSVELDATRFPSFTGTPAERLEKLNRAVQARGWRGLGIWICNSRNRLPGQEKIESDDYWKERLEWSQKAGVLYWKVDWGIGERGRPLWKFRMTPQVYTVAPDVWIEFASGIEPDVYRTYDVGVTVSISETIRRIGEFLNKRDEKDRRLINCEDEVFIGAALGCHYGIMRHPLHDPMPNEKPDHVFPVGYRDLKHRMDEITRAVRWHRLAQPFAKDSTAIVDTQMLTDFKCKPAPARIARGGIVLPEVKMPDAGEPPFVVCARHPEGEIAITTAARKLEANGKPKLVFPLADVAIDAGDFTRPIGIFGEYASLTLLTPADLVGKRILAQDLAGNTPVDITSEVQFIPRRVSERRLIISPKLKELGPGASGVGYDLGGKILSEGRLVIPGAVLRRVGLMNAKPGDVSDPGLVLGAEGITKFEAKPPMKPRVVAHD